MNKETIEKIKQLRTEGKTYKEIAKILGISPESARYHCLSESKRKALIKDQHNRFMKQTIDKRRKVYEKRKEYQRAYYQKLKRGLI